ncbi:MAG: hypothetical protein IPP31_10335 [Chitinophagaceae bacterium]|nr:hypothetical protein [Chitinophagaceae bacterium]
MRILFLFFFSVGALFARGQKVESIYVNLYTDSLKKGTFNYINIDGKLSNGRFIPLDSTYLIFWSSAGHFSGNSLWIDKDTRLDKVDLRVTLRSDPALHKEFSIYIKKMPDPALKSLEELMKESRSGSGKKKN